MFPWVKELLPSQCDFLTSPSWFRPKFSQNTIPVRKWREREEAFQKNYSVLMNIDGKKRCYSFLPLDISVTLCPSLYFFFFPYDYGMGIVIFMKVMISLSAMAYLHVKVRKSLNRKTVQWCKCHLHPKTRDNLQSQKSCKCLSQRLELFLCVCLNCKVYIGFMMFTGERKKNTRKKSAEGQRF